VHSVIRLYSLVLDLIHGFLQAPLMTLASNAGVDGAIIIGKLIEQEDLSLGYDAAKGLCFF
jgi:chaperonin GroEL